MNAVDPQPMINARLSLGEDMVEDKVTHGWANIFIDGDTTRGPLIYPFGEECF